MRPVKPSEELELVAVVVYGEAKVALPDTVHQQLVVLLERTELHWVMIRYIQFNEHHILMVITQAME